MDTIITIFLINAAVIILFLTTIFILALTKKDNSIMDIAYGPTFAIAGWTTTFLTDSFNTLTVLLLICISLWSLRLSIRIGRKNWGKPEDIRYANWRSEWSKKSTVYFIVRSYMQVYVLQGLIIAFVSMPIVIGIGIPVDSIHPITFVGVLLFIIGITIETVADYQLDTFIKKKKAGLLDEPLMKTGLFKYSRRPNYFGESTIWFGLACMVLPYMYGYLALISPVLITYIVTKVTGPMLEKIFLEQYPKEYAAYMKTTSYFIPLPPKKV